MEISRAELSVDELDQVYGGNVFDVVKKAGNSFLAGSRKGAEETLGIPVVPSLMKWLGGLVGLFKGLSGRMSGNQVSPLLPDMAKPQ